MSTILLQTVSSQIVDGNLLWCLDACLCKNVHKNLQAHVWNVLLTGMYHERLPFSMRLGLGHLPSTHRIRGWYSKIGKLYFTILFWNNNILNCSRQSFTVQYVGYCHSKSEQQKSTLFSLGITLCNVLIYLHLPTYMQLS